VQEFALSLTRWRKWTYWRHGFPWWRCSRPTPLSQADNTEKAEGKISPKWIWRYQASIPTLYCF